MLNFVVRRSLNLPTVQRAFHRRGAESTEAPQRKNRRGDERPLLFSLRHLRALCVSAVKSCVVVLALLSLGSFSTHAGQPKKDAEKPADSQHEARGHAEETVGSMGRDASHHTRRQIAGIAGGRTAACPVVVNFRTRIWDFTGLRRSVSRNGIARPASFVQISAKSHGRRRSELIGTATTVKMRSRSLLRETGLPVSGVRRRLGQF